MTHGPDDHASHDRVADPAADERLVEVAPAGRDEIHEHPARLFVRHRSPRRPVSDDAQNLKEVFDAAMTIHVAMNIAAKDRMYIEARRVLKPGGVFAVYDVLQGEGGEVLYPVPWARDSSISHLATPEQMKSLLACAGFKLLDVQDSTEESQSFFERMTAQMAKTGTSPVIWQLFLGDDFPAMARNQVRNVTERRIRTVSYICGA